MLTEMTTFVLLKLGAVLIFSPVFIFPAIAVAIGGGYIANKYMKAQLSVKRELSNTRAPVLSHFGAAISGLISIRAYGAQNAFKEESHKRINIYSRAATAHWNLNR